MLKVSISKSMDLNESKSQELFYEIYIFLNLNFEKLPKNSIYYLRINQIS